MLTQLEEWILECVNTTAVAIIGASFALALFPAVFAGSVVSLNPSGLNYVFIVFLALWILTETLLQIKEQGFSRYRRQALLTLYWFPSLAVIVVAKVMQFLQPSTILATFTNGMIQGFFLAMLVVMVVALGVVYVLVRVARNVL